MDMNLFQHQQETVDFLLKTPKAMITSSPGTGKTISTLEAYVQRNSGGGMVIICPKTIMEAAWGKEIKTYYPHLKYEVLDRAKIRKDKNYLKAAFDVNDVIIFNFEMAGLILEFKDQLLPGFDTLVIDEFTAVKNRTAQRSENVERLSRHFTYLTMLSGSPMPNTILDIWHPMYILDQGQRLGHNYFNFRNAVCQPVVKGNMRQFTEWVDIPGSVEIVAGTIRDVTIRHQLEDVVDMPERLFNTMTIPMNARLRKAYEQMAEQAILELQDETITAVNRAVLGGKLLQIASGSVYNANGDTCLVHDEKYNLVAELIDEREQSLVFYQWQHQCDTLSAILTKTKLPHAIINGKTPQSKRGEIVNDFQNGKYRTLLIQPAAAAHGLTLTKSTCSIWISPTFNLEHFEQANHRDYRIGQSKTTEVIMIEYEDTIEPYVYKKLQGKQESLSTLLQILKAKK
jgi:SNF2 family DNA or RNA helicase